MNSSFTDKSSVDSLLIVFCTLLVKSNLGRLFAISWSLWRDSLELSEYSLIGWVLGRNDSRLFMIMLPIY